MLQTEKCYHKEYAYLISSLPHDLIKTKLLSPVKWCFNRVKTYLCRQKGRDLTQSYDKSPLHQQKCQKGKVTWFRQVGIFFFNRKYDTYKCWTSTEFCKAFSFVIENIYMQFEGWVYQKIFENHMGTNCATHSRCVLILLREGFYV